jgi:spore germination protein GerM
MRTRAVLGVLVLVIAGVGARTLPQKSLSGLRAWWPWTTTTVTLFFPNGDYFVPVSRPMSKGAALPGSTLQALLDGPARGTGLSAPMPTGLEVRSLDVRDGTAWIDLSSPAAPERPALGTDARTAILETLTALPTVTSVSLSLDGQSLMRDAHRIPLLYYASANGLVALPTSATTPQAALTAYLTAPPDSGLTTLPSDVRVLDYRHDTDRGVVSINFSYTPLVRTLALEQPERMRLLLLGLIASLTEFPSVESVRLDFEGRTRLGLGQCSDLLRTFQRRPELLNDERLLGR